MRTRTYLIDGQAVTVTWFAQRPSPVYTIQVAGVMTAGSVEKTRLGTFLVTNDHGRPLGTFITLRAAVEHVVQAESH